MEGGDTEPGLGCLMIDEAEGGNGDGDWDIMLASSSWGDATSRTQRTIKTQST